MQCEDDTNSIIKYIKYKYFVEEYKKINNVEHDIEVKPSVYLKNSVRVISGDGTSSSAYKLEID